VTPPVSQPQPAVQQPRNVAPAATDSIVSAAPQYAATLERARAARNAGNIISPANENAIELFVAAAAEASGDLAVEAELEAVVGQALGIAESAILANNASQAEAALEMARFADPGNPRLTFLNVQVEELLLRDQSEQARLAMREGRFEDAGRLISEARSIAGSNNADVNMLSEELNSARSQQQVGATITTANDRLEAGNLVAPSNDNARYYFELALSNDPQNQAAQQGLITIASKLVLQARDALDNGRLDQAEGLLSDARELDPSSSELGATAATLGNARESEAAAARAAETARVAELERQQEAARVAELNRQAELERQAEQRRQDEVRMKAEAEQQERDRVADQQRQAIAAEDARTQAEVEADKVATASPLGVGAQAPSRPAPQPRTRTPAASSAATAPPPGSETRSSAASSAPAEPPLRTEIQAPATEGVTTFGMTDSGTQTNTVTQTIPTRVQTQAASAVNVQANPSGSAGTVTRPQEPEMVPVSRLTRTNYVGPEYPRSARRRNVQGSVDVGFTVTTDGKVRSVYVLNSDPGDTFDQAALDAVEKWRFEPVVENGLAVEKRTAVRLAFNLQ